MSAPLLNRFCFAALVVIALGTVAGATPKGSPHPAAADPAVAFVNELPSYKPAQRVSGTVVLWGHGSFKHDFMGALVKRWISGLNKTQPGIALDFRMYGTASAIAALFTGTGNLAILGEEISPTAKRAFERAKGYSPTRIDVATGSLETNFFDYAHMIFVHEDNPLEHLTLAQLDAVFGSEHRRGDRNIRKWGELGLKGKWAQATIQPYGWKVDEDFALFFREAVLQNSHRWNNAIQEFVHVMRPDGTQYDHGQQILDALAKDPRGIAISNVRYQNAGVKVVEVPIHFSDRYSGSSKITLGIQAEGLWVPFALKFADRQRRRPLP